MTADHATQKFLLTERQAEAYRLIAENPEITHRVIALKLGVTVGAVQAIVRALFKKGYLASEFKKSAFELSEKCQHLSCHDNSCDFCGMNFS